MTLLTKTNAYMDDNNSDYFLIDWNGRSEYYGSIELVMCHNVNICYFIFNGEINQDNNTL